MEMVEKTFRVGPLDYLFPWHMQLGRWDPKEVAEGQTVGDKSAGTSLQAESDKSKTAEGGDEDEGDFPYTPFKIFSRRRNFLVWMHSRKFDHLFSEEDRALM